MFSLSWNFCTVTLLIISLVIICLIGDSLTNYESRYFISNRVLKCIADSCTHAIIGIISWAVIIYPWEKDNFHWFLLETFFAGVLATSIDLDHFFESRSIDLQVVLSLERRPFLHNTSLTLLIFTILLFMTRNTSLRALPFMFFVSSCTHHLRDANRRGLWFWGYETLPLPQYVYLLFIIVIVFSVRHVYWHFLTHSSKLYVIKNPSEV